MRPEFETLDRAALAELQLRRFRQEFRRMWTDNTFFRRRFEEANLTPDAVQSLDDLPKVPIVRKADILADAAAQPPFGTRLGIPTGQIAQIVESSGSSGLGREVQALSAADLAAMTEAKAFQFYWAGCRQGTVVALHVPFSMAAGAVWNHAALTMLGSNVLRLGSLEAGDRLDAMRRYRANVTAASTSYLMRLEYAAEQAGLDLQRDFPDLTAVFVGSGGWTTAWAIEHMRRWNVRMYEVYANSQRAFAYTCEWGVLRGSERGILHSLPHLGLLEVVDPATGVHVAPGEEGEIVITPFGMAGTPLIRYGTNDRGRYLTGESCPCGRHFDGIEAGSVARYDGMLRIREVNVWPETIDEVVLAFAEVEEYRGDLYVDERGREIARVSVEIGAGVPESARPPLLERIADQLHERIRLHFTIEAWRGASLRQASEDRLSAASLKIKRWQDNRSASRDQLSGIP
jgi:phenylacetate-CoA ligase